MNDTLGSGMRPATVFEASGGIQQASIRLEKWVSRGGRRSVSRESGRWASS